MLRAVYPVPWRAVDDRPGGSRRLTEMAGVNGARLAVNGGAARVGNRHSRPRHVAC